MTDNISGRAPGPGDAESIRHEKMEEKKAIQNRIVQQVASKNSMKEREQEGDFSTGQMMRRFRGLEEHRAKRREMVKQETGEQEEVKKVEETEKAEESASQFQKRNPELQSKTLIILRSRINAQDDPEEIIRKVMEMYPDHSLADEAMEYLENTTAGRLAETMKEARSLFNERFPREIKAGYNIHTQAREFSEQGLGSPTALRDMYRDITGNPREPNKLFEELSSRFTYQRMKTVIDFLLNSLGSDLKAKGPSISRAELKRLIDDTRTLQAILGVYRFFRGRMKLVHDQFASRQLSYPTLITFELIAKQFMRLLTERYLSPDRVLQLSRFLGISEEAAAQVVIFTQMRDAVRQVAPKLYRSNQHRQEVLIALIEALEDLEEQMEEEEEENEDEEEE